MVHGAAAAWHRFADQRMLRTSIARRYRERSPAGPARPRVAVRGADRRDAALGVGAGRRRHRPCRVATGQRHGPSRGLLTRRTRVLVVDDQDLIRSSFRLLVESDPDLVVVGEASTGGGRRARHGASAGCHAHGHPHARVRGHHGDPRDLRDDTGHALASCSSAGRRSRPTSAGCSPSWTFVTAPSSSCSLMSTVSCSPVI